MHVCGARLSVPLTTGSALLRSPGEVQVSLSQVLQPVKSRVSFPTAMTPGSEQESWPWPHPLCHVVGGMGEGKMTSSSIATCKESWPQGHESGRTGPVPPPAPTAARRKTNPVPRLCRTLELTLLAGVQVRKPWGHGEQEHWPCSLLPAAIGEASQPFQCWRACPRDGDDGEGEAGRLPT